MGGPPKHHRGPVFGQAMQKKKAGKSSNYQRQFGGSTTYRQASTTSSDEESKAQYRQRKQAAGDAVDESFGVERFCFSDVQQSTDCRRRGWLYNVRTTTVRSSESMSKVYE
jgi:hypothetical protein